MQGNKKKNDLIMEAALTIFEEKGIREATIAEIAERAGVASGTVYEYFSNKEDLFFSIPNQTVISFNEQLVLHLQGLFDPIEKIRKYIWFYLYFFEKNPVYTELLLMELRVNKNYINSDYYDDSRKATAEILKIIKEGQESGRIRNDVNPFIVRHMILGPLEHITTHWLITNKEYPLTTHTKDLTTLIISAIIKNAQPLTPPPVK